MFLKWIKIGGVGLVCSTYIEDGQMFRVIMIFIALNEVAGPHCAVSNVSD